MPTLSTIRGKTCWPCYCQNDRQNPPFKTVVIRSTHQTFTFICSPKKNLNESATCFGQQLHTLNKELHWSKHVSGICDRFYFPRKYSMTCFLVHSYMSFFRSCPTHKHIPTQTNDETWESIYQSINLSIYIYLSIIIYLSTYLNPSKSILRSQTFSFNFPISTSSPPKKIVFFSGKPAVFWTFKKRNFG